MVTKESETCEVIDSWQAQKMNMDACASPEQVVNHSAPRVPKGAHWGRARQGRKRSDIPARIITYDKYALNSDSGLGPPGLNAGQTTTNLIQRP